MTARLHGDPSDPSEELCEVTHHESAVADARRFAERSIAEADPACREAVAMAVQELAENLAKYGPKEGTAGTISLRTKGGGVTIRVNGVACSREDGERVREMIAEINEAPSVGELYRLRQLELFEDPSSPRVRLGLLRIAFEGGFRLSCSYEHPLLEIVAERE